MLELKNICFGVDGGRDILQDVSLTLDGHVIALTGPNGGGKSTLAKIIAGIIKPTSGQILLDGEDITHMSITERANHGISYAFQQPVRFKGLRVKDLLDIATGRTHDMSMACRVISEVGLCARDYLDRELNDSLSGGEMKRIEIAMTLARGTKLNIFDEPEAGIDLWSFARLTETFEQIHRSQDATMIIISHQERIIQLADEIVVVAGGEIAHRGSTEEIFPLILANTLGGCPVLSKEEKK